MDSIIVPRTQSNAVVHMGRTLPPIDNPNDINSAVKRR